MNYVGRIADKNTQSIRVVTVKDDVSVTKTFNLSNLNIADPDYGVEINGSKVAVNSFEEAMNLLNSNSGATLKLGKDEDVSKSFAVTSDGTINLNGHTLSHSGNKTIFQVSSDATLTIDGSTDGSALYGRINVGKSNDDNGNVVINGGTYSCGNDQTVMHLNGTCKNSSVTINNAVINSPTDNGIQLSANGTYRITNSQISGKTGIYLKSGELTITGCEINSTSAEHTDYNFNNNGSNATGDAIVVDSCSYPGGIPTLVIREGNTISSVAGSGNTQIGYYEKTPDVEFGNVTSVTNTYSVNEGYSWVEDELGGMYKLVKAL